ncbi:MAG: YceI family protein [Gammaproteobacteria bacterium]
MPRNLIFSLTSSALVALLCAAPIPAALAAEYEIDPAHSFVQFKTQHLGYSWLVGRFNDVKGSFSYDAGNPAASAIEVTIDTASVDSNHAKRDKHLRSEEFLDADEFPEATFKSTAFEGDADGGKLTGELTLHGVTLPITLEVSKIGEGDDPWGGYRAGFEGTARLTRADYAMDYDLGPGAAAVDLELYVEGIRK